mmetsp:Transcript_34775/g.46678  ORF Transcript_34775/g.46678 Transcript_34775/m.46678 type:complete len:128 (+) Transcript_34775:114-497(+)
MHILDPLGLNREEWRKDMQCTLSLFLCHCDNDQQLPEKMARVWHVVLDEKALSKKKRDKNALCGKQACQKCRMFVQFISTNYHLNHFFCSNKSSILEVDVSTITCIGGQMEASTLAILKFGIPSTPF